MNQTTVSNARLSKHIMNFILLAASLIVPFAFSGCSGAQETAQSGISTGSKAPEIIGEISDGKKISLGQHKGALVLVEFWDSGNSEARKNHFEMQRLYNKFKDADFKEGRHFCIFSVSLDTDQSKWAAAVSEDAVTWPCQINDPKGWNAESATTYGVNYTPRYILVGSDGTILDKHVQIRELEQMLQDQLVKRQSRP